MAMVLNPTTGQYEDDGLPELDGAAPMPPPDPLAMPGVGPENLQAGDGGAAPAAAPAPAPAMVPVLSAKPEWENRTSREVKSADVVAAEDKQEEARRKRDEAQAADTEIKRQEAVAKSEDATLSRLAAEREAADRAYWESEKRRKVEENKASDKREREESAKDEKLKNEAGNLTGAAKTWATILTAIGTIGQGLAAAGSRGAQAWADGNPIAKLYEEDRQRAVAKALKEFEASERARQMAKEGRTEELEQIKEELTIGVNNRIARDKLVQGSILAERVAKLGPQGAKVAGELLKTGQQALDATTDLENAARYNSRQDRTNRAPTAGAGANAMAKPASEATRNLAVGAAEYDRLAAENLKILEDNGGKPPIKGAEATTFDINEKAMARLLQVGESDSDAKTARDLQSSPGFIDKIAAHAGVGNTVENYKAAVKTNSERLKAKAADTAAAEGKAVMGSAAPSLREQAEAKLKGGKTEPADIKEAKAYLKDHPDDKEVAAMIKRRGF